jgi:hypothetical protein
MDPATHSGTPMTSKSQARLIRSIVVGLALACVAGSLTAQGNRTNETGLPMYPTLTTGSQYPVSQTKEGKFLIYTAQTKDAIDMVEAWYRRALPHASESTDDSGITKGIVLTNGKDKVLIYQLGKMKGAVVELQKFAGP